MGRPTIGTAEVSSWASQMEANLRCTFCLSQCTRSSALNVAAPGMCSWMTLRREESQHPRILRPPRATPSSGDRLSHADGCLARWRAAGSLCTCGQRIRVDLMPTGRSETAADRTLGALIKDNQQTASNLTAAKNGPAARGPLLAVWGAGVDKIEAAAKLWICRAVG